MGGGLAAAFAHNFAEMWIRWFPAWRRTELSLYERIVRGESYYTHGPLVPLVSLVIIVVLLRHTRVPVRPRRALGGVVLAGSLLVHLLGCLARVNFISGYALVGVLMGLVLYLWGSTALRRLWFPLALLVFMVPLPEVSVARLNFRLKVWAAQWGVGLANLLGILVVSAGNRVYLAGGKSMVIANVCNGLRTLISLIAFGALYAYVCRLRGLWRVGLFAMSVPVAILSNSIRILGLIAVADIWDVPTATGWFHDISGLMIYVIAFLLMFGVERLVLWARRSLGRAADVRPLFDGIRRGDEDAGQWSRLVGAAGTNSALGAAVAVVLAAGAAGWFNYTGPKIRRGALARQALPRTLVVAGRTWEGEDGTLPAKVVDVLETDDYLLRRYHSPGVPPVDIGVIFSIDNRKGTHPPEVCEEGLGRDITAKNDVVLSDVPGRGEVPCKELIVQAGREQLYVLYTFKCGNAYTRSFWRQQFTILINGLLNRNASGALVRVSTSLRGDLEQARERSMQLLRTAVPHLDRKLP